MNGLDQNKICNEHMGHVSDIKHLTQSDLLQWVEINRLKAWLIATLTTSLFTLLGVIVNVVLLLPKK